jgi:hypothetical protein
MQSLDGCRVFHMKEDITFEKWAVMEIRGAIGSGKRRT